MGKEEREELWQEDIEVRLITVYEGLFLFKLSWWQDWEFTTI